MVGDDGELVPSDKSVEGKDLAAVEGKGKGQGQGQRLFNRV